MKLFRGIRPLLPAALAAAALMAAPAPSHAEEELAPGYDACLDRAGGVTADMKECAQAAYDHWDRMLNTSYSRVRKAMGKTEAGNLLKAQRLWIQYRDAMSQSVFDLAGGGSAAGLDALVFMAEETRKQARLLVTPLE